MVLIHVLSAIVGVIGGYAYSVSFFRAVAQHASAAGFVYAGGRAAMLVGLLGVALSGLVLFLQTPELFFTSHIFLSHITVMALIALIELGFFSAQSLKIQTGLRVASCYSWSFVLVAALAHPEVSYFALMAAYISMGIVVLGIYGARFAPRVGRAQSQRA